MPENKRQLRALIHSRKQNLTPEEISEKSRTLCRMVTATSLWKNAKTIFGYLPFNQEVQLLPLLQQALAEGKQVALPKCCGKDMRFILMTDLTQATPSPFGAPEPLADGPVADDKTALVLVPGVVFDERGYRIGYGGGYYDRFLAAEPEHPTIGLCFDIQLVSRLEPDPYDIPVDIVFVT